MRYNVWDKILSRDMQNLTTKNGDDPLHKRINLSTMHNGATKRTSYANRTQTQE
jgi:hypothetical protein